MTTNYPGEISMRVFRVAMLVGILAVPAAGTAYAQMTPGFRLNEEKTLTEEEMARAKANEAAAKAARAKIPDAKPNADPWASVRGNEPAAKTTKSAGAKARTSAK
jgi:hypothetical protein